MFQLWYIPKIEDELVVAEFETEDEAQTALSKLKDKRPKVFPYYYIWDTENKNKINYKGELNA
tara:strand:- start:351 stop:539 length:189 start_codon:yes stop_codon:yes gene_type:complete